MQINKKKSRTRSSCFLQVISHYVAYFKWEFVPLNSLSKRTQNLRDLQTNSSSLGFISEQKFFFFKNNFILKSRLSLISTKFKVHHNIH